MTYKVKCTVHGCTSLATHIDEAGRTFCTPCATKAANVQYGGKSKPLIRLDVQEDKLGEALAAALYANKRDPDPEMLQHEAKASLVRYFKLIDKPLLAEAIRRAI